MHHKLNLYPLAGSGLGLAGSTLGGLLANNTTRHVSISPASGVRVVGNLPAGGLASSGLGGGLGLLSLLRALGGSALLLALLDGGLAGGRAGLGTLCATLLDHVEGSTNDGTLGLDLTATAGLGSLLW
jgi:hypothetical protein